jgi:hypothetical protein
MAYEILQRDGVIRIRFLNDVVPADLQTLGAVMDRIDDELPSDPNRLVDLADTQGEQIDFSRIVAFADLRKERRLRNAIRVAMVARAPLQFGVARMFQSLFRNPQMELRVFRELAAAEAWVAGSVETPLEEDLDRLEASLSGRHS